MSERSTSELRPATVFITHTAIITVIITLNTSSLVLFCLNIFCHGYNQHQMCGFELKAPCFTKRDEFQTI